MEVYMINYKENNTVTIMKIKIKTVYRREKGRCKLEETPAEILV